MLLKQFDIRNIPDQVRIGNWEDADPQTDTLAPHSPIKDFTPLCNFPNLRHLWINRANFQQLDQICHLTNLETLSVDCTPNVIDLEPLSKMTNLCMLSLTGSFKDICLDPLGKLSGLRVLALSALMSIAANCGSAFCQSLRPLANLSNLEYLELFAFHPRDKDLTPLTYLKSLKQLDMFNSYSLEDYARLAVALPDTKGIFQCPYHNVKGDESLHCKKCGGYDLVCLRGKRRRTFVCRKCDKELIEQHIAEYERLKSIYTTK